MQVRKHRGTINPQTSLQRSVLGLRNPLMRACMMTVDVGNLCLGTQIREAYEERS